METEFKDLGVRGNSHADTEHFDDASLVEGGKNVRLTRIRVWYDDFVYGLQTIYESSNNGIIVSPKRMNPETEHWNLKYEEIFFNRNESIIRLYGHAGAIIDHVGFVTNKGRELRFGLSDGGDPFDLDIPEGSCVGTLKGGYGGHLHNIGCSIVPLASPLQYQYGYQADQRVENQVSAGPTHGDTVQYNDVQYLEGTKGQHRIKSISVHYNDSCVFGLVVRYEETGKEIETRGIGNSWNREEDKVRKITFAIDEWIKNIYGYFGTYCDRLVFETTKGRVESFGSERDPNFNFEIPENQVVSGISFGIGGHLHNITAYYGRQPHIFRFEQPEVVNTQYSLLSQSTETRGGHHGDTKNFDDWDKLDQNIINTRLTVITVYYQEGKNVYGFRQEWNVNEKAVEGDKHRGSEYDGWVSDGNKKKISLKYGQYITRVYGRCGNIIDRLCFELNTGEIHEFGGDTGEEFDLGIPEGHGVGCLTGGHNGHLHNIQVWYGKINSTSQSQPVAYYIPSDNRWPHEVFHGNNHPDTSGFRDEGINFNAPNFRIYTLKVWYTNQVVGIQCIYEVEGQYIYGEKHMASAQQEDDKVHIATLNMTVDEFITKVNIRSGNVIDHIHIQTNKGHELKAGGDGGDEHEIDIPQGYCVGAIEGGKNGHIHNLRFHCGPIPQVMTTYW